MLLASLEQAAVSRKPDETNWTGRSAAELIEYIVTYHHRYLKSSLPQLSQYVNKVARVHGPHHPELLQVQEWFQALRLDMELHMEKEENEAFPAVIAYELSGTEHSRQQLLQILEELENDHRETGNLLQKIRIVTSDFTVPEDACTTFKVTYLKLEELEADMFQHIHLENNILFARAALGKPGEFAG
jgi:regulator of cell morphogenesis and NO signaling